jgi:hypothetical protein
MARTIPTVGWICTDPRLLAMAEIMLDDKYEERSAKLGDTDVRCVGRIGSVGVVISCLPVPPNSASFEHTIQNMITSFSGIKSIIVTGLGCGIPGASILPGDLAISLEIRHHDDVELSSGSAPNSVQHAVHVLQREVGEDGHWLSNDLCSAISSHQDLLQLVQGSNSDLPGFPHIHYENINSNLPDAQIEKSRSQLTAATMVKCFDAVVAGTSAGISYENAICF